MHGFWAAAAEEDDIVLATGNGDVRFPMLRQQGAHDDSRPNRSLADFVAPAATGLADHIGGFAVGVHGADELASSFQAEGDDYNAIMVKALADRLAEAFAEWLHLQSRRAWYAPAEHLGNDELVAERYRGIRPAFGYPACPDHSMKPALFSLLRADEAGLSLTENRSRRCRVRASTGSISGTRRRGTLRSAASGATRWRTTRRERGRTFRSSSAGYGPILRTTHGELPPISRGASAGVQ